MRTQINSFWPKLVALGRKQAVQWAVAAVILLVVLVGLGAMLYDSRELLLSYPWRVYPVPLATSFLTYSFALGLAIWAWGMMVNSVVGKAGWLKHARIYCLSNLGRRLPGLFWDVVGRVIMYQREGLPRVLVTVVSGLEFVLLLLSGIVVTLLTWPLLASSRFGNPWWLLLGLISGLVAIHPTIIKLALRKLSKEATVASDVRYRDVVMWLTIYAVIWGIGGIILFSMIATIYPVSVTLLPGIIGVWSLSGVVSMVATFSPSGLGIRELTLSMLLSLFIPAGVAVVVAILARLLLTLYEVLWALATSRIPSR